MNAIILAGAPNKGPLRQVSPAQYEAEIEIAGRPMLDYVVLALERVQSIKKIVIVGSESMLSNHQANPRQFTFIKPGPTMIESLENGIRVLNEREPVLVLTSDIPLITKEALEDFLNLCRAREGEIYYSFVPKTVNDQKYPGVQRTYVRLKEGTFTGGNLVLFSPEVVNDKFNTLKKAIALRKKPFKLCAMLGWLYIFKLLFGVLTIKEIENRVTEIFGMKAVGIVSLYPEVGIDVDKPSDLKLAREVLTK
ncbi:MAG: NTP transferase domain-containing protein [Firmicutes bacterium]|nr:NTP transferase domain-containing protein [Bacillota bacterium]